METIFSLPPVHAPAFCAIDTEWFKMRLGHLHRPNNGIFACMQICYDGESVYMLTKPEQIAPALDILKDDIWTFAEAKFDLTHLRRYATIPPRRKVWDVVLFEKIMYSGYYELFGLKPLVRRYLQIVLEKEAREAFETSEELTEELIQYAATDAWATWHVRQEQAKLVDQSDMKVWHEIDRPALWAILDMPGFRINVPAWGALEDTNKAEYAKLCDLLPYKPLSYKKIVADLRKLGWKNLKDSKEKTLVTYINKHPDSKAAEQAKLILDARGYGKMVSTYGRKMIDEFGEWISDDVCLIFSDFDVIGTETGRTSSSNPNLQNIPSKDTKAFRDCFIPRPGNVLIILDYSAQEPRITAYLSQDGKLIKIFKDGKDVYIELAKIIFNKTIKKRDPLRKKMKGVILGMSYGLTEYGLAIRENMSVDEAAELLGAAWKAFPESKRYIDKQRTRKGIATSVFGRKFYINPYNEQHERNCLNAPVQASAGDMFKMAFGAELHQHWDYEKWGQFGLVNLVHDELVLDVPKDVAPEIAEFAKRAMIKVAESMCPGMPFDVDVHIGNSWAEKES